MPQYSSIIANTLCAAAIVGGLGACKHDASPRAEEALKWANKFYAHYAIRGNWFFFGAEAEGENVMIFINVPETQADQLMELDDIKEANIIARNVCPPPGEDFWSLLNADGDLIIETRKDGNVFAKVSCKTGKKED